MRRPVWLAAGVALGVGGTLWAERRVRTAVARLTPEQVAAGARDSVRQLGGRVRSAVEAGREARSAREEELWEELAHRAGAPGGAGGNGRAHRTRQAARAGVRGGGGEGR
jgi:hypothetical protein